MKKLNLLYLLISALIFGACKDDTFGSQGNYSEGEPAMLVGSIKVPAQQKISSRAIGQERETAIEQLAIIAWEINSGRKLSVNLTDKIANEKWEQNGMSIYKLTEAIPVQTGHYRAYIIANWKSYYGRKDNTAGNELTFEELEQMSEAEIQQITFWNYGNHIDLYGNDGFPMTQVIDESYNNGAGFVIGQGENELKDVYLNRASAHIQFKIYNGNDGITDDSKKATYTDGNVPNFVPQRYAVFRVPSHTNAFKKGEGRVNILKDNTFDQGYFPITKQAEASDENAYEFDFHMLENKQPLATAEIKSIGDRERWDYTATNPEAELGRDASAYADRKFINAPEGATFVVIEGTYSGPARKENGKYSNEKFIGNVSYIIHLGNFNTNSTANNHEGSMNDFSVLRNELQIYKINVQGAHSIVANVEVIDGQNNPAIEGDLSGQPVANLDAHYAKIMMRIPKNAIESDVTKNTVAITSVKNGFANTAYTIDQLEDANLDIDYKWVQFQKPTNGIDEFPRYAGVNNHSAFNDASDGFGYISDLTRDLAAYLADNTHQLKYAIVDGDYFYTAAFVDENIYNDPDRYTIKDWAGIGVKDRRIALNPESRKVSPDGTSILSGIAAINIRQKPVSSTYSLDASVASSYKAIYNPFGLEQVMEPTATVYHLDRVNDLTDNQKTLIEAPGNNTFTSAYTWDAANNEHSGTYNASTTQKNTIALFYQFNAGVADDNKSFYKIASSGSYEFYPYGSKGTDTDTDNFYMTASKGLVVHNRDLNGDGKITSDEVRWYIPGYVQLLIYNFGYNIIPEELRLQSLTEEAAIAANNNLVISGKRDDDLSFPRYFTTSTSDNRLYWQDQRGASSWIDRDWASKINRIRFARNLGQFDGAATEAITRMTITDRFPGKNIILIRNANITRNYAVTGFYPFHYCTSEYNLLPSALEYKLLKITDNGLQKSDPQETLQTLYQRVLDASNATGDKLPDGWRVANQRELLTLYVQNIPQDAMEEQRINITNTCFLSCSFINSQLYQNRLTLPININGGNVTLSEYIGRSEVYVYLVRDVDPDTGDPIADSKAIEYSGKIGRGILKR